MLLPAGLRNGPASTAIEISSTYWSTPIVGTSEWIPPGPAVTLLAAGYVEASAPFAAEISSVDPTRGTRRTTAESLLDRTDNEPRSNGMLTVDDTRESFSNVRVRVRSKAGNPSTESVGCQPSTVNLLVDGVPPTVLISPV